MKTSKQQILQSKRERSISLPADSPVNHSLLLESDSVQKMNAIFGPKCFGQYVKFAPAGSWQRMFVDCLVGTKAWYSKRCALTWRLKVTRYFRSLFQLQVSVPRTGVKEYGLLLTPSATMILQRSPKAMEKRKLWRESAGRKTVPPGSLAEQVKMIMQGLSPANALLPTPTTMGNRNSRNAVLKIGEVHQNHGKALGLAQVAELSAGILPKEFNNWLEVPAPYKGKFQDPNRLLKIATMMMPTPISGLVKTLGMKPETIEKRIGDGRQEDLNMAIYQTTGRTGQLNTLFVQEMMGFPTSWLILPFQSGGMNP